MENIDQIANGFVGISLSEMEGVQLMNRTDTKFLVSEQDVASILQEVKEDYRILEIKGTRLNSYETLYYDTPDFLYYRRHHSGKKNRLKIRKRRYVESNLTFLEVKFKSNKDRTIKSRIKRPSFDGAIDQEEDFFIHTERDVHEELEPKLWNNFSRITLVGRVFPERITIDLNISFRLNESSSSMPGLAIVEVKQGVFNRHSPFMSCLKKRRIRPESVSKYCLGIALLKSDIKSNNFKNKLRKINRITNGIAA